jgi:hypothetical protein
MTGLLLAVGMFVFFISVGGAVLVGGHLLGDLDDDGGAADQPIDPRPDPARLESHVVASDATSDDAAPALATAAGGR